MANSHATTPAHCVPSAGAGSHSVHGEGTHCGIAKQEKVHEPVYLLITRLKSFSSALSMIYQESNRRKEYDIILTLTLMSVAEHIN